jgi:hypothetical protein
MFENLINYHSLKEIIHEGARAKTGIRIMYPRGATCLPDDLFQ